MPVSGFSYFYPGKLKYWVSHNTPNAIKRRKARRSRKRG